MNLYHLIKTLALGVFLTCLIFNNFIYIYESLDSDKSNSFTLITFPSQILWKCSRRVKCYGFEFVPSVQYSRSRATRPWYIKCKHKERVKGMETWALMRPTYDNYYGCLRFFSVDVVVIVVIYIVVVSFSFFSMYESLLLLWRFLL